MLDEKVIIIAGGNGRLGKSFSDAVIRSNGICIIADVRKPEDIEEEISPAESAEEKSSEFIGFDITSLESIKNIIEHVSNKYSRIDAFVNATYPRNRKWGIRFEDVDFSDFCENAILHLGGYFLAAQQFCEFFKKQGYGNLIQIASVMGVVAPKFDTYENALFNGKEMTSPAEYSMFKAAIIHFARYIAKYYKGNNIRSNCISPGGILAGQPETFLNNYKKYCTSKGMLDPGDVTGALLFLLSDQSYFINGQNIVVDDGWSL